MSNPANLTYSQIETRVMNQLRIPVTNTTEQAKIQALINEVYRDICAKQDWWWLWKYKVINTGPKITAGTVNLTQNSINITFSTAPQQFSVNANITGFALIIPAQANDPGAVYRIASQPLSTTATLDGAYTDTTNTTATFRLYQDSYALPNDVSKLLMVKRFGETQPIKLVGINDLSRVKLSDQTEGRPELVSIYDYQTTGDPTQVRMLQIHPYPDKAYRMEVWYKQSLNTELTGSTQPFIPDDYRQTLIYGALARGYPIFLNDMDRGGVFQALFNDLMALMSAQQKEYAHDQSGIDPSMGMYRKRNRRPRTAFTLGNWFDRLPMQP